MLQYVFDIFPFIYIYICIKNLFYVSKKQSTNDWKKYKSSIKDSNVDIRGGKRGK